MKDKIKLMSVTGVLTAAVYVLTAYLQFPSHAGYVHVGDGLIYLAACILPLPYAMFVGAGGAMLADVLSGYAMWAPGTIIIKAAATVFFSRKSQKIISGRNLLALLPAWAVCIVGYYLYEALITWNFVAPLAGMPASLVQSVFSSVVFIVLGLAMDRFDLKQRLFK